MYFEYISQMQVFEMLHITEHRFVYRWIAWVKGPYARTNEIRSIKDMWHVWIPCNLLLSSRDFVTLERAFILQRHLSGEFVSAARYEYIKEDEIT